MSEADADDRKDCAAEETSSKRPQRHIAFAPNSVEMKWRSSLRRGHTGLFDVSGRSPDDRSAWTKLRPKSMAESRKGPPNGFDASRSSRLVRTLTMSTLCEGHSWVKHEPKYSSGD
jgi:hypothetical protein